LAIGYQTAQQAVQNNNNNVGDANLTASDFLAIGYQAAQQAVQNTNNYGGATLTASDFLAIGYQAAQQAVQNMGNYVNMTVLDILAIGYQAAQLAMQNRTYGNNNGSLAADITALGYQAAQQAAQNNNNGAAASLTALYMLALGNQTTQNVCRLTSTGPGASVSLTANALTALGYQAAQNFNNNVTLSNNNATVTANDLIAIGYQAAGYCNNSLGITTNGLSNIINAYSDELIAIGTQAALHQNDSSNAAYISAVGNIAIGQMALQFNNYNNISTNTSASFQADYNIAIGYQALMNNNSQIGASTNNAVSSRNIAIGYQANLFFGTNAANTNKIIPYGNDNIVIGNSSSIIARFTNYNTTVECDGNIIIGKNSTFDPTNSNTSYPSLINSRGGNIIIGDNLNITGTTFFEENLDTPATFVANINGTNFGTYVVGGFNNVNIVAVDAYNRLGYVTLSSSPSSRRFKEEVRPLGMTDLSARFQRLQPVSFVYRSDPTRSRQYGLVAEDVLEVFPECVEYETDPKTGQRQPLTVRYNGIIALLVKRIQEQDQIIGNLNKVVQDQNQKIDELNRKNDELTKIVQDLQARLIMLEKFTGLSK